MNNRSYSTLLTVAVFVYNHEQYIEQTLLSVLRQKCDFEIKIIVCDDCSTDSSYPIISNIARQYPNLVFPIRNERNLGLNQSFYNVIKLIDSKYIAILGGDDYWIIDNKLQLQVSVMEEDEKISYVHTAFTSFREKDNSYLQNGNINWYWRVKNDPLAKLISFLIDRWSGYPLASTSCMRTCVLQKGLKDYLDILMNPYVVGEGTFINVSVCMSGGKYAYLPLITTVYTIRENSLSHYFKKDDLFRYRYNYFRLKEYILRKFSLSKLQEKKVRKEMIAQLYYDAIQLNQKKQFRKLFSDISDFEIIVLDVTYFSKRLHNVLCRYFKIFS